MNPPNPRGAACSADWEMLEFMRQGSRTSKHVEHAPDFTSAPLPIVPENEAFADSDNSFLIELLRGRKVALCMFPCEEQLRFLDWEEDDTVHKLPCRQLQSQTLPHQQLPNQQLPNQQLSSQQLPSQQLPSLQLPSQQLPSQQLPNQQLPNQQLPNQQLSSQQLPSQQLLSQQLPSQQLLSQQLPSQQLPSQQLPSLQLPSQQLLSQQLPSQQLPNQQLPNQQLPSQQLPNHQLPSLQLPSQQLPSLQFPNQQLSSLQLPSQQLPSQQLPNQQLSSLQLPSQQLPSLQFPSQQLSSQQLPSQQLPSQQLPSQQLPSQQLPSQQLPSQQLPSQQLPSQQLPNHQLPSLQLPSQQLPSQQLPNQQLPSLQLPSQQLPSLQLPSQQLPNHQLPSHQLPNHQLPNHQLPNHQLPNQQLPNQTLLHKMLPHQEFLSQTFQNRSPPLQVSQPAVASKGRGRLLTPPTNKDQYMLPLSFDGQITYTYNPTPIEVEIQPQASFPQHQSSGNKPPSSLLQRPLGSSAPPSYHLQHPLGSFAPPSYYLQPSFDDGTNAYSYNALPPLDGKMPHASYSQPPGANTKLPAQHLQRCALDETMLLYYHQPGPSKASMPETCVQEVPSQPRPPFKLPSPVSKPRNKLTNDSRAQDLREHPEHGLGQISDPQTLNIRPEKGPVESSHRQNQYSEDTEKTQDLKSYPEFRREPHWTHEYMVVSSSEKAVKFGLRGRGRLAEGMAVLPREETLKRERRFVADFGIVVDLASTAVDKPHLLKSPYETTRVSSNSKPLEIVYESLCSVATECRPVSDVGIVVDKGQQETQNSKTGNSGELNAKEYATAVPNYKHSSGMKLSAEIPDCIKPQGTLSPRAQDSKLGAEKRNNEPRLGFAVYLPPPARKEGESPKAGRSTLKLSVSEGEATESEALHIGGKLKLELDVRGLKDAPSNIQSQMGSDGDGVKRKCGGTLGSKLEKCSKMLQIVKVLPKLIPEKETCSFKPIKIVPGLNRRDNRESTTKQEPISRGTFAVTSDECGNKGAAPKLTTNKETLRFKPNTIVAKACKTVQDIGAVPLQSISSKIFVDLRQNMTASDDGASPNSPGKGENCKPNSCSVNTSVMKKHGRSDWNRSRKYSNTSCVAASRKYEPVTGNVSNTVESKEGNLLTKVGEEMPKSATAHMGKYARNLSSGKVAPRMRDEHRRAVLGSAVKEPKRPILREMQKLETNIKPSGPARVVPNNKLVVPVNKSVVPNDKPVVPNDKQDGSISKLDQVRHNRRVNAVGCQNFPKLSECQVEDLVDLENWDKKQKMCSREQPKKASTTGVEQGAEALQEGADTLQIDAKMSILKPFPDLDLEHQCLILPAVTQSGALFSDLEELLRFGARNPTYN